jgi:hypothetical protein
MIVRILALNGGLALAIVGCLTPATAQTNYGNSALGGMTPQPAGNNNFGQPGGYLPPAGSSSVGNAAASVEQGFVDFANEVNAAGQQASGPLRGAVDGLGRAITQPIGNARQAIGEIVGGPESRGSGTPGQPMRNLVDGAGRELQNTADALRGSVDRAGENLRNTFGAAPGNPLSSEPPGWNQQPAAVNPAMTAQPAVPQPNSWGTANDALRSPPPGFVPTSSAVNPNERSVVTNPQADTGGSRPAWSSTAQPNTAQPNNGQAPASEFDAPPLRSNPPSQSPSPEQPNQQPATDSRLFNRLVVEQGPMLNNPNAGDSWGNPRTTTTNLAPIPGIDQPWGTTAAVNNTSNPWTHALSQPYPTQPSGQPTMPRLEVPSGGANVTLISDQGGNNNPNNDALNLMDSGNSLNFDNKQSSGQGVQTNAQAGNQFLNGSNVGWTGLIFLMLVGSAAINFYQWFNIVDLRHKYRNALRRSSPSLASTV